MNKTKLFRMSRTTDDIKALAKEAGETVTKTRAYLKKKWREKADDLWRQCVRNRDGWCIVCGRADKLDTHHLIRRGYLKYRHDPMNGVTLCPGHHTFGNCGDGICAENDTRGAKLFLDWLMVHRPEQFQWLHENKDMSRETMTWTDFRDACERLES